MLTQATLERIAARTGLDAPVRFDEVTGSTNATAASLAGDGAPEWTLVAAGHQTAGRGRLERSWSDRPGRALLLSLVLRPELEPRLAGLLSLLAGMCMSNAAAALSGLEVRPKWPNDLLVQERKVGGVLAESAVEGERVAWVVLGIGVNLGDPPPDVPGAGALEGVDAEELLEAFLRGFRERYRPAEADFAGSVVAAARDRLSTLGRRVRATTTGGEVVEGTAVDLDERGGLVLETTGGRRTVAFGDVEHLR